jgi:hypothetical protein
MCNFIRSEGPHISVFPHLPMRAFQLTNFLFCVLFCVLQKTMLPFGTKLNEKVIGIFLFVIYISYQFFVPTKSPV